MAERTNECKCASWCDSDMRHRVLTGHHITCPHAPSYTECLETLIAELVAGIEYWGCDCEGVHEKLWPAYRKAKAMNGIFVEEHQMTEHTLKTTVPPPEGWKYQGEFRVPEKGEYFLWKGQPIKCKEEDATNAHPILRRARWVPKPGDMVWLWSPRYGVAQVRHDGDLFEAQISFRTKEEAVRFGVEVVALAERMQGEGGAND